VPESAPPKTAPFSVAKGLDAPPEDTASESFARLQAHADTAPRRASVQDCPIPSCELILVEADSLAPREARVTALETAEGTLSEAVIERGGHVIVRDIDVPLEALELGLFLTPHEDGRETLEVEVRKTLEAPDTDTPNDEEDEGEGLEPPWLPFGDVLDD